MLNENQNQQEVWRTCFYNGIEFSDYEVSSLGRVRSLKGKSPRILKQCVNKQGYYNLTLCKDSKKYQCRVNRLVLFSFQEIPDNYQEFESNHINEIKSDNRLVNLEWVTASQNINHATRNERVAKANSKTCYQFDLNGNLIKVWQSATVAARELGFCRVNICKCCNGKRKTHMGFKWSYSPKFQTV